MRIAYILNTLQLGGAERQVLALAERMHDRGHLVKLIILRKSAPRHLRTHLDTIHLNAGRNPARALRASVRAFAVIRDFSPQVVHSHQFHGNMLARMLKLAMPSIPVLSTIHNVHEGGWARMLAYRVTDPLATRTIAVCNAAAERFIRIRAISARKTAVIPNGIDCAAFAPDAARRVKVRKEMSAGEFFIWLAVGRITPAKDYPTLLRAFECVHVAHPETRLWIAGEGKSACVAGLQRLSEDLGIGSSVRWLGLHDDIPALLDAADAFVLSSAWEGMPLALGEAMAMEKPFVATDVGGVREMAGDCGVLVRAGEASALSEAMSALVEANPGDRRSTGEAGRARIVEEFNIDTAVDAWESCYLDVVAARE